MNISLEKVTDFLKPFLLKDIIIRTDKKVLKKGKFMIFQIKVPAIHFLQQAQTLTSVVAY